MSFYLIIELKFANKDNVNFSLSVEVCKVIIFSFAQLYQHCVPQTFTISV